MKSEWRVSSEYMDDEEVFQVYRIRNVSEADHSGNREYFSGTFDNRAAAQALADKLNKEGNNET